MIWVPVDDLNENNIINVHDITLMYIVRVVKYNNYLVRLCRLDTRVCKVSTIDLTMRILTIR